MCLYLLTTFLLYFFFFLVNGSLRTVQQPTESHQPTLPIITSVYRKAVLRVDIASEIASLRKKKKKSIFHGTEQNENFKCDRLKGFFSDFFVRSADFPLTASLNSTKVK